MSVAVSPALLAEFVGRWQKSAAAERANYQLFLTELCGVIGVPTPEPTQADVARNAYVFERDVTFQNLDGTTSIGRIDLYKRGCFVLEAKQGSEALTDDAPVLSATPKKLKKGHGVRGTKGWDDAMLRARGQAEQYARALPTEEGWPVFLIVVDVGHSIELFADFTRSGKTYLPFPDPKTYRILLPELSNAAWLDTLRQVWTDPQALDPTRRAAKVTRELADRLARLAKSLEQSKFEPGRVAQFLMRCLFTMFAEDVELIPRDSFSSLLKSLHGDPKTFPDMVRSLWESMNVGNFSPILRQKLRRFNGGLFEDCEALPLTADQLSLLTEAAQAQWRDVEPAIFGTLLERALDPIERHKLGAHYTPRAYVERLVLPTIVEPLRDDWDAVRAAALTLANRGETAEAVQTVRDFHRQLCETRVLDPACGSGNFLYVALEHMKRLEGEVLNTLIDLGYKQKEIISVDPHQFLGIEVNPRAAAIADLVLWIGYLQWHVRTRPLSDIAEPIIQKFHNIECRDAVLAWDRLEPVLDDQCKPVTRWNGRTMKKHPVTGEDVPDETARVLVMKYINPRKAEWPEAEFIVGNPPFLGKLYMLERLGDGTIEALRNAYSDHVPDGSDFVMYWWFKAATLVAKQRLRRFGLITTKSISQAFNRRVVAAALNGNPPASLRFAISNHPWVDSENGAAVRIAMTVGESGQLDGKLCDVISEASKPDDDAVNVELKTQLGRILEDLRIGADVANAATLRANSNVSGTGLCLGGRGFVLSGKEREELVNRDSHSAERIFPLRHGRDLTETPRGVYVIDTRGETETSLRTKWPELFQRLKNLVFPERQVNRDPRLRKNWWLFRRTNEQVRAALDGLERYLATSETSRHRIIVFFDGDVRPEHKLVVFGFEDAYFLGILSSRIHVCWAIRAGGRLGAGDDPVYSKTNCFEKFPFPVSSAERQSRIRDLAEQLDAHRKKQQAAHPDLTLTGMYNVLEKLRAGEPLTAKEKTIHEQGLVSVLKQIHDDLDAAVFEAYGWPTTLTDEEILERLVALNAERAVEEARGLIRWLRPEFQNPAAGKAVQQRMDVEPEADEPPTLRKVGKRGAKPQAIIAGDGKKAAWPKKLAEQVQAVVQRLQAAPKPVTAAELAKSFTRAKPDDIAELLDALVTMGKAREVKGKYVAA